MPEGESVVPKLLQPQDLGRRIKELRGELTLAELAALAGKPGQGPQIGRYEKGKVPPSLDTLAAIARARGVPLAVFYEEEPTETRPLTTQDVARLRDEMRSLQEKAGGVLATLEAALNGRPTLSAKDEQTGGTAMKGVVQVETQRNGEEKPAARSRRRGSHPEPAQERDDQ